MIDLPTGGDTKNATQPTGNTPVPTRIVNSPPIYKEPKSKRFKRHCHRVLCRAPVWIEAACALALVAITGTYTYYTGGQLRQMRKAAKATQVAAEAATSAANTAASQLELTTRAWIGVTHIDVRGPVTYPEGPNKPIFMLEYSLENFGHSPAFVIVVGRIIPKDTRSWRDAQRDLCDPAFKKADSVGEKWGKDSWTVIPGHPMPYDLPYGRNDKSAVMDSLPKTDEFTNVGCVVYRSIVGGKIGLSPFVATVKVGRNPEVIDVRMAGDAK